MVKNITILSPPDMVDDVLFDMRHHQLRNTPCGEHTHECVEIGIVYGGQAKHLAGGHQEMLQQGDVFIILYGCSHQLEECRDFDHVTVSCSPQLLDRLGINLSFIFGIRDIFKAESPRPISFHLNRMEFTDAKKLIDAMLTAYGKDRNEEKGNLRSYFAMLLCLFAQSYSLHHNNASVEARTDRAILYMNEHFGEPLRLPQLAAMANLSVCEFGRIFKKQFGVTPMNYVQELRLAESLRLLRHSQLSIAEIAFRVGINDSNYFSKIFHARFNLTPRQIRSKRYEDEQAASSAAIPGKE